MQSSVRVHLWFKTASWDSLQTWTSPLARRARTGLEMNPCPPLAGILTPPLKARQPCRACAYQGRLLPPVTLLHTAREVIAQIRGDALTSAARRQYARGDFIRGAWIL